MTDVRKLLARLNPSTCRFDIGRGGVSELTPQDIAAALGMIPAGLGRELVCRIWWPDGARLGSKELDAELRQALMIEWLRRARRLEAAKLQLHIADDERRASLTRARSEVEAARSECWPKVGPQYKRLRATVLNELAHPAQCGKCQGRGHLSTRTKVVKPCEQCNQTGTVPVSDRKRADALGINESSFRRYWRSPYLWLLAHCVDAEAAALRQLGHVLTKDEIAA